MGWCKCLHLCWTSSFRFTILIRRPLCRAVLELHKDEKLLSLGSNNNSPPVSLFWITHLTSGRKALPELIKTVTLIFRPRLAELTNLAPKGNCCCVLCLLNHPRRSMTCWLIKKTLLTWILWQVHWSYSKERFQRSWYWTTWCSRYAICTA